MQKYCISEALGFKRPPSLVSYLYSWSLWFSKQPKKSTVGAELYSEPYFPSIPFYKLKIIVFCCRLMAALLPYLEPLVEAAPHNVELVMKDGTAKVAGLHVGHSGQVAPAARPLVGVVVADLVGEPRRAEPAHFHWKGKWHFRS